MDEDLAQVMKALDRVVAKMSVARYVEFLETLVVDVRIRLEAARADAQLEIQVEEASADAQRDDDGDASAVRRDGHGRR